jgi:hypothetical protein
MPMLFDTGLVVEVDAVSVADVHRQRCIAELSG